MRPIVERMAEALINKFSIALFVISFLIFSLRESCSHVPSILFNIMALNEAGLTFESCTSREPAWKVPSINTTPYPSCLNCNFQNQVLRAL